MLIDTQNCNVGYTSIQRLRNIARELIPRINTEDFYIKWQLYVPPTKLQGAQRMNKHIINWLYTVKCESGASGLKYINIILKALIKTLKRDLNELQEEYVYALIDIFHAERNLYK